jgi:hypothetical protein
MNNKFSHKVGRSAQLVFLILILGLIMSACDNRVPTDPPATVINYNLSVTTDRSVIYADNGKTVARITATLLNENNEPQQGSTIIFSALTGAIASNIVTNSSGRAEAVFDDKGQAALGARIVARYTDANGNTVRDTVTIDILPLEELVSSFFASTNPVSGIVNVVNFDTSYSAIINANVRDSAGVAVNNVVVKYRVIDGISVGFLDVAQDSTNAAGNSQAVFTTNEGSVGSVRVVAYVETNALAKVMHDNPGIYNFGYLTRGANVSEVAFSDTVALSFTAGEDYTLDVLALDELIYADQGETIARIRAIVRDGFGSGVDTFAVRFSSSVGTISSLRYTNEFGVAEAEFSDLGTIFLADQPATIRASIEHPYFGILKDSVEVMVIKDNPYQPPRIPAYIDFYATYNELPPVGEPLIRSTMLRAVVTDTLGYPVDKNTLVRFSTSNGFVTPYATTDSLGTALGEYSISDSSGITTVYARSGAAIDSVLITVRPGGPANIIIPPTNPNVIVVQGGWGIESTSLFAEVRDAQGELVDLPHEVCFVLGPNVPIGVNLNGDGLTACVETNNGIASVTLNSGVASGPVRVTATVVYNGTTIRSTSVPVTVAAGPPAHINADIDINAITPIGGGIYELEAAAVVWDQYSNPVEDSTQIYWQISPVETGDIIGESFTFNSNLAGERYHGIAWTKLYFNSGVTFDTVIISASTWGGAGEPIVGIVNEDASGDQILPFYPGTLLVTASEVFWDFANGAFTVTLTANLSDFYGNPIVGGRILFSAIGGTNWNPDPPIVPTDDAGQAVCEVSFDAALCEPNIDAEGEITSYNPFTAYVWATLIDPRQTTSEQTAIELRHSIQQ